MNPTMNKAASISISLDSDIMYSTSSDTTLSAHSPPLSPSFSGSKSSSTSTRNDYLECGRQGHPTTSCVCPRAYRWQPSEAQRAKWKRKAKYLIHLREKRKRQRERELQGKKSNIGSLRQSNANVYHE
eukprot:344323_1